MSEVILPKRKIFKTPRLLVDAYTIGSGQFQSTLAKDKSVYYVTFRRILHSVNPKLYDADDHRIIFTGIQRILERLFYDPITHEEIDETKRFLANFRATNKGLARYEFDEQMWRDVVDHFNGRPPILIEGLPEGSVVYPNEPALQIWSQSKHKGELSAWFESKLLQVWSTSARVTQNEHFYKKVKEKIKLVNPNISDEDLNLSASLILTDFGDRAGMTEQESEELGMVHLYTFPNTDTTSGAYQAWKNAGETFVAASVYALAHRNVQSYEFEGDCYETLYNESPDDSILSMVDDCYDSKNAVIKHLIPLALRSIKEANGKIVVARPDSGNPLEEVMFIVREAVKAGLVSYQKIDGKTWKFPTSLRFIEGDGMTFDVMLEIMDALIAEDFAFYAWGLFGSGGGLRNGLSRDMISAKYALNAMGYDHQGVVKFSETLGKTTLCGPFKLLRTPEALESKRTIIFDYEVGPNALVEYFNGLRINKPFGIAQDDDFPTIRARIREQMDNMPLNLYSDTNHNYPASQAIITERRNLLKKYAPSKDLNNY